MFVFSGGVKMNFDTMESFPNVYTGNMYSKHANNILHIIDI